MLVRIGAYQELTNFTIEEKSVIVDELTLLNPKYVNAMRNTSYTRISIPKYNEYYYHANGRLLVPRGYKIPFEHEIVEDERFTLENIEYPKFKLQLRDTQKEAVEAYLKNRDKNNGVIVLPTGKGKSILGLYIAKILKQRALIIVHKDDLIDGWKADAKLALGLRPKQIGLIKGADFRLGRLITLATIQTLAKQTPEQLELIREYFSMVLVDEFHHSAARIYEFITTMPAFDRIGLTATDMRNDGLENVLNFYFGDVCYRFEETDDDEDIIAPKDVHIIVRESNINYNPPTLYVFPNTKKIVNYVNILLEGDSQPTVINIHDLSQKQISELEKDGRIKRKPLDYSKVIKVIQNDDQFNVMVAHDVLLEYKAGKSCLVFCKEKDHVRILEDKLLQFGVPKETIQLYYGDTKGKYAKVEMKKKAESGECLITIATYAIVTEGTNVKKWEVGFLAMTFNNEKDTIQAIGRLRRKLAGKSSVKIYDYRHYGIKGARNHGETRDKVYNKIGFKIQNNFSRIKRGY